MQKLISVAVFKFSFFSSELQSCVSVWDINLPHEVQNLKKHIEMRQELAEKMKSFSLDWKVTLQVPFSFLVFHPNILCNTYNFFFL